MTPHPLSDYLTGETKAYRVYLPTAMRSFFSFSVSFISFLCVDLVGASLI